MGAKNNQETTWHASLDADNFDPYRPGMSGCYKCPVCCRANNDMLPGGKGGWGASALTGLNGNAIAWAMELYQRGIIDQQTTGGLDLSWGNYPVIEQLLFMSAKREGFGDTIATSSRAVEQGKYP